MTSSRMASVNRPHPHPLPYLLITFAFLVAAIPGEAVIPGPLRGNGSPPRLIALVMAALVLLSLIPIYRARQSRSSRTGWVGLGVIALYLASRLIVFALGDHDAFVAPDVLAAQTRFVLSAVVAFGVAVYTMAQVRDSRSRDAVLIALLVGISVSVVVGLIQGVIGVDYRDFLVPPGFERLTEKGLAVREGYTRVIGTSAHPIEFAVTVSATLPLAAHYARYGTVRSIRVFATVLTVLLLVAVPASVSRTAIVTLVAAGLVYLIAQPVRLLLAGTSVLALVVGIYYVIAPDLFEAVMNLFTGANQDPSVEGRTDDYTYVGDLFRAKPWFGYGPASTLPQYTRYLDNQWLQELLIGGVLGVAMLTAMIIGGAVGLTAWKRTASDAAERDLVFAVAAGFVALVVSTTVFDMFAFQQAYLMFFLFFGIAWTGGRLQTAVPEFDTVRFPLRAESKR